MSSPTLDVYHSFFDLPEHWQEFLHAQTHPFLHFHFWQALEESGSIGKKSGWIPSLFTSGGAMAIGFIKTHSYGEYIFDWDWAQAFQEYQIPYYPKLTFALPFTPVQSPKLLGEKADQEKLLDEIIGWQDKRVSGTHFLFTNQDDEEIYERAGFKLRHSFQYHWKNPGTKSFDDFLGSLKKSKRKNIKKERQSISESSLSIQRFHGDELRPEHAEQLFQFYIQTSSKKWGHPYLNQEFFHRLFELHKDRILYVSAELGNESVAGSFFLYDEDTLYGRYWGSTRDIEFLHFELCYYQGIDFCLEKGIPYFEAGAQGEHKISRGFLPTIIHSQHMINSGVFKAPVEDFIEREKEHIGTIVAELEKQSPFKSND